VYTCPVAALGLDEPDDPNPQTPYALMLQKLARFLLDQLSADLRPLDAAALAVAGSPGEVALPLTVTDWFGVHTRGVDRCLHCGLETPRESTALVVDLAAMRKARHPVSHTVPVCLCARVDAWPCGAA
jgi:hypothetical protein